MRERSTSRHRLSPFPTDARGTGAALSLLLLFALACSTSHGDGGGDRAPTSAAGLAVSTFQVEADRLAYDDRGQGCPVLLVAGGSGMDLRQWDDVAPPLAESYRVIRFDPRGVGSSDVPTTRYSDEEDLGHLLDHLEVERAALVGVSSAGGLVLGYAAEHPERVLAVVVSAPFVPGFEFSVDMQQRLAGLGAAAQQGREPYLEAMLADPHFLPAPRRPAIREIARRNMGENYDKSLSIDPGLVRPLDPPLIERLEEIGAPTLLLAGELDHPEIHRRQASFHQRVPRSASGVIAGAGHNPQLENPSGLLEAVEPFLERHCVSGSSVD